MLIDSLSFDQQLFLAINGIHAAWADTIMWWVSGKLTWLPLYLLLIGLIVYRVGVVNKQWRNVGLILLAFVLTVVASDQACYWLKHWIARPRPSHEPLLEGMVHLVNNYHGGAYGHPSSHAANTMAVALLYSQVMRKSWVNLLLAIWVLLNCYSRIYLGVHYPGDIIVGLMVGMLIAVGAGAVLRRLGVVGKARSVDSQNDRTAEV